VSVRINHAILDWDLWIVLLFSVTVSTICRSHKQRYVVLYVEERDDGMEEKSHDEEKPGTSGLLLRPGHLLDSRCSSSSGTCVTEKLRLESTAGDTLWIKESTETQLLAWRNLMDLRVTKLTRGRLHFE
jgi:hypothetical protein